MSKFAADTGVPADRSRAEIERTLARYGADGFMYATSADSALVAFTKAGLQVRFVLAMPLANDKAFTHWMRGGYPVERTPEAARKLHEQATRQRWRALALVIKAKLEAVDAGISVFEDEFLANIVLPGGGGQLAGEWLRPQIAEAYRLGTMPPLLAIGGPK